MMKKENSNSILAIATRTLQLLFNVLLITGLSACASKAVLTPSQFDSSFQGPPKIELSSVQKRRLAQRVAQHLDSTLALASTDDPYTQRLISARDAIEKKTKESYRYGVYLSNRIHAFALASGDIRIHSGLLDVINDNDKIIALLACLQTEIRNGYSDEAIEQAYNAAVATDPTIIDALKEAPFPQYAIAAVANRTSMYRFSLEQLKTCDKQAAQTLRRIGRSSKAALGLLSHFQKFEDTASSRGTASYDINRTHPYATERLIELSESLGVALDPETAQRKRQMSELATASSIESNTSKTTSKLIAEVQNEGIVKSATLRASDNSAQDSLNSADIQETEPNSATPVNREAFGQFSDEQTPGKDSATDLEIEETLPTTVPNNSNSLTGWFIQMSADATSSAATARKIALIQLGFETQLQEVTVNGVDYVRVLVGPFESRQQASLLRAQLQETGLADGQPFVRQLP